MSRGGYPGFSVSNSSGGGTLTATSTLNVYEPLIISPFLQKGLPAAFVGLNQATITINISDTTLQRLWSVDTTSATASSFSAVSSVFNSAPQLFNTQLTPSVLSPIPQRALYAYDRVYRFLTPMSSIAPK